METMAWPLILVVPGLKPPCLVEKVAKALTLLEFALPSPMQVTLWQGRNG